MKKSYAMFLSLLLAQTTPVWAMIEDDDGQNIEAQAQIVQPQYRFDLLGDITTSAEGNSSAKATDNTFTRG